MESLLRKINKLKRSRIKKLVDSKIRQFESVKGKGILKELCFCITTANCSAEKCIQIQKELGDDILKLNSSQLSKRLKQLGYRFHNRAPYMAEACKNKELIKNINSKEEYKLRDWLAKSIKGLGYKEASHFLRNIGYKDFAIIDFHIIDLLVKNRFIKKPKTMTKKTYLEIEKILDKIAKKAGLSLAELDLYLWYMETGKVLK